MSSDGATTCRLVVRSSTIVYNVWGSEMLRWLVRRVFTAILVLWAVSTVVFFITHILTDPAAVSLPVDVSEAQRELRRHLLGLDKPLLTQYGEFVRGLATFDLGDSFWTGRSAWSEVSDRLPNTLKLVGAGMFVSLALSIPLGLLAAWKQNRAADKVVVGVGLAAISAPPFWIAYLLIIVFAVQLGWLPSSGSSGWKSIILPAVSIGLASAGRLAQLLRGALLEEMRQPYALTARSRGFSRAYTLVHHVMRNVAASFTTVGAWEAARMFTGYTIVVEFVFAWPGVGLLAINAIDQKDLILVQACVLMLAALLLVTNLAGDILRRVIDPRVELA